MTEDGTPACNYDSIYDNGQKRRGMSEYKHGASPLLSHLGDTPRDSEKQAFTNSYTAGRGLGPLGRPHFSVEVYGWGRQAIWPSSGRNIIEREVEVGRKAAREKTYGVCKP